MKQSKFNDLSQLKDLKEKMQADDENHRKQYLEEVQFTNEFFSSSKSDYDVHPFHFDPIR